MPLNKPIFGSAGQPPDVTADYEDAGTKVLTTHAREEMTGSVERLRRNSLCSLQRQSKNAAAGVAPRALGGDLFHRLATKRAHQHLQFVDRRGKALGAGATGDDRCRRPTAQPEGWIAAQLQIGVTAL